MRRALLAAVLLASTSTAFAANQTIIQKGRRFHPGEITIAKGDALTFTNDDEFIHQIFVQGDGFNFDSEEKAPGNTITEAFPVTGTFEVHCHIHPVMKLIVHVR